MKWCFLVNDVDFAMEFLGKLSEQVLQEGNEVLLVFNSKISEYRKRSHFPKNVKVISKVDWLLKNYQESIREFDGVSWKEFLSTFERKKGLLDLNYENSAKIISQTCQFFEFLFQTESPDVMVGGSPANVFTSIAYQFCSKYNCRYLGFIDSRINERTDVFDEEYSCSLYKKTFDDLSFTDISESEKKFAEDFIENFLLHKKLPANIYYQIDVQHSSGLMRYIKRLKSMAPFWWQYLRERKRLLQFDYETEMRFIYEIRRPFDAAIRAFKKLFFKNTFSSISSGDRFFLFPLHFYPEASILVWATYYADQLATIKNIAFSLPFPYKLYVKEHPMAVGVRTFGFYKKLKKIPNVVLIAPNENVKGLLSKSQGVITLTSTMGLEAALLGKPVYVLGNVFYEYHPGCKKIKTMDELKETIASDMKKPFTQNEEENIRFITSYFKNTIPGSMCVFDWKEDPNNYKHIYENVKKTYEQIQR